MMNPLTIHPRSRRADSRGFSLIEALVAIVIFALMMMGTIPLFIKSTTDVARNRNMLHYNNGMQALLDELTTRYAISATDARVNNDFVYTNASCSGSLPTPCGTAAPDAVNQLFLGNPTSDRVQQNNLLAQVQYAITMDGPTIRRIDINVYYYTSARYVAPVSGTSALTPAAARVLHMSSVSASGYLNAPVTNP